MRLPTALLLLVLGPCETDLREPQSQPVTFDRELVLLRPTSSSAYLEGSVGTPGLYYHIPRPGDQDCSRKVQTSYDFVFEDNDDFIDVTINDGLGVGGELGDSRSYRLVRENAGQQDSWDFVMEQRPNPSSYLHVARWRIKQSATPTLPEVGNGTAISPPLDQPPWERPIRSPRIAGRYRLYVLGGTVGAHVTASLVFHFEKTVTRCPD